MPAENKRERIYGRKNEKEPHRIKYMRKRKVEGNLREKLKK